MAPASAGEVSNMASKIGSGNEGETAPVIREVEIEGYTCIVTMDKEGIHFRRKGAKGPGEKPAVHLKWGDAMEIGAERQGLSDAYTHLGFDK